VERTRLRGLTFTINFGKLLGKIEFSRIGKSVLESQVTQPGAEMGAALCPTYPLVSLGLRVT
jgi:hypothetical protein